MMLTPAASGLAGSSALRRHPGRPSSPQNADLYALVLRLQEDVRRLERTLQGQVREHGLPPAWAAEPFVAASKTVCQYKMLEDAITEQVARRALAGPADRPEPTAPLNLGPWRLEDDGWSLARHDFAVAVPLSANERAVLTLLAQAPQHRVGEEVFLYACGASLGGTWKGMQLVRELRSRVRALGADFPLRRLRDGSYRFMQPSAGAATAPSMGTASRPDA